MITKLTPEQEREMVSVRERWMSIGLSCDPVDQDRTLKAISAMYVAIGKPAPTVLVFSSPMMCMLAYAVLRNLPQVKGQLSGQLSGQLYSQLRGQLRDQLRDQLSGQLYDQLSGQLYGQLSGQLSGQLYGQLSGQLRGQLRDQLSGQLYDQLRDQLSGQLYDQLRGQLSGQEWCHFAGNQWCAFEVFYSFARQIGVQYSEWQNKTLDMWLEHSEACHWWWPYNGMVLASDRPREIHLNSSGQLHKDEGMAVRYSDGWGVHFLNGVSIPSGLVMARAEELDPKTILTQNNVEVRRELLRKVGIERFLNVAPHRVLDTRNDYALLSVELTPEIRDARFLKMLNPSIGVWHVEGVAPECETVQHALNYRAGLPLADKAGWSPAVLT
jgi:hypothetical protein